MSNFDQQALKDERVILATICTSTRITMEWNNDLLDVIRRQIEVIVSENRNPQLQNILLKNITTFQSNIDNTIVHEYIHNFFPHEVFDDIRWLLWIYKRIQLIRKYFDNQEIDRIQLEGISNIDHNLYEFLKNIDFDFMSPDITNIILTQLLDILQKAQQSRTNQEQGKESENKWRERINIYRLNWKYRLEAFLSKIWLRSIFNKITEILWIWMLLSTVPIAKIASLWMKNIHIPAVSKNTVSILKNADFANSLRGHESSLVIYFDWHNFDIGENFEKQDIYWFEILNYDKLDSTLLVWEIFYRFIDNDWQKEEINFDNKFVLEDSWQQDIDHSFFLDRFDWKIDDLDNRTPIMVIQSQALKKWRNSVVIPRWYIPVISNISRELLCKAWVDYQLYCIKDTWYFYIDLGDKIDFKLKIEYRRYWDKEYNWIFFNTWNEIHLLSEMVQQSDLSDNIQLLLDASNKDQDIIQHLNDITDYLRKNFLYSTSNKDTVRQYRRYPSYIWWISYTWVWDCKNINALNIALMRILGIQSQELAWFTRNDAKYHWHGVTEVNLNGKSKIFDATPYTKKSWNKFHFPNISLPNISLPNIGETLRKFKKNTSVLSKIFLERLIRKKIERLTLYLISVNSESTLPPIYHELKRLPDIRELKDLLPSDEYRKQVNIYHKLILYIEVKISHDNRDFYWIDTWYLNDLSKKNKVIHMLKYLIWEEVVMHKLFFEIYNIYKTWDQLVQDEKYLLLASIKRLYPNIDIWKLDTKISQLWLAWIYTTMICLSDLDDLDYIEYCFYPRLDTSKLHTTNEEISDSYSSYREKNTRKAYEKKIADTRRSLEARLLNWHESIEQDILKQLYNTTMEQVESSMYQIQIEMWTWILGGRLSVIHKIIDGELRLNSNSEDTINKYIDTYWEDDFIRIIFLIITKDRTVEQYHNILSREDIFENPLHLLWIYHLLEYDMGPRIWAHMLSSKHPLDRFDWIKDHIRDILLCYWENNSTFILELFKKWIHDKWDREIVWNALKNISKWTLEDYELWLNVFIDDAINSMLYTSHRNISWSHESNSWLQDPLMIQNDIFSHISWHILRKYYRNMRKKLRKNNNLTEKEHNILWKRIQYLELYVFRTHGLFFGKITT